LTEEIDPLADWFADPAYCQERASTKKVAKRWNCRTWAFCRSESARRPVKLLSRGRDRWEAVRGAFATCPGSQVDNQRVLLV